MSAALDLTGQRFGKLLALEPTGQSDGKNRKLWRCRCDCGGEKIVSTGHLKSENTKSCGCLAPEPASLKGRRFGRLKVLMLLDQRRNGKQLWLCVCDCGREKEVTRGSLLRGYTKSCGCLLGDTARRNSPFHKSRMTAELKARTVVEDGGEQWYAARKARKVLGCPYSTLYVYADPKKGSPWLGGDAIRTRTLPDRFGVERTYYAKADVDAIKDARAKLRSRPEVPRMIPLDGADSAATEIGRSARTVRDKLAAIGVRPIKVNGKSADGRALRYSYVPQQGVEQLEKSMKPAAIPPDKITRRDAAQLLGITIQQVHTLVRAHGISTYPWREVCQDGYLRPVQLLSRAEVEAIAAKRRGSPPGESRVQGTATMPSAAKETTATTAPAEQIADPGYPVNVTNQVLKVIIVGQADEVEQAAVPKAQKKAGRGRPKGAVDPERQARIAKMTEDWLANKFDSKSEAARAHGFHPSERRLLPDRS